MPQGITRLVGLGVEVGRTVVVVVVTGFGAFVVEGARVLVMTGVADGGFVAAGAAVLDEVDGVAEVEGEMAALVGAEEIEVASDD
jgi:hypothetical protein